MSTTFDEPGGSKDHRQDGKDSVTQDGSSSSTPKMSTMFDEPGESKDSVTQNESSSTPNTTDKTVLPNETKNLTKSQEERRAQVEEFRRASITFMKNLLKKSSVYSTFFKRKVDEAKRKAEQQTRQRGRKRKIPEGTSNETSKKKRLKITGDEIFDEELLLTDAEDKDDDDTEELSNENVEDNVNLKYFTGTLRPYQVEGLNWLKFMHASGCNGMLADEMGLGKTVQVIALISYLYENKLPGPYLILAPLSTLPNWRSEFERFAPKIPLVVFHGNKDERIHLCNKIGKRYKLDSESVFSVILTTYQMPLKESKVFQQYNWQYIVIDEGQRIKNHESKLSLELKLVRSKNKLLLTGTPLQNNLTELGALLNFLMPHIFTNVEQFASLLMLEDVNDACKILAEEKNNKLISTVHGILEPFMLRRLKADVLPDIVPKKEVHVYCAMSPLQQKLYKAVFEKKLELLEGSNIENLLNDEEGSSLDSSSKALGRGKRRSSVAKNKNYLMPTMDQYYAADAGLATLHGSEIVEESSVEEQVETYARRITMSAPMLMLKKIVHHPYLIRMPLKPNTKEREILVDEQLITHSGKMIMLDAMLPKLKESNHKVLIFCTLTMTLDLIEELFLYRGYTYRRLDGKNSLQQREESMAQFNTDPDILAFMISTRAGGLGLNLVGADTVIFFDRDWNPQVDIQAQDRCHRIGQTKPVMVYTLVSKGTIDEKILHVSGAKRTLERLIMKKSLQGNELEELSELLHLNENSTKVNPNGTLFTDKELDDLLDRSELIKELELQKGKEN